MSELRAVLVEDKGISEDYAVFDGDRFITRAELAKPPASGPYRLVVEPRPLGNIYLGWELTPEPLDLVHRHPDIPVNIPLRNTAIKVYDMVLPTWPDDAVTWTPFRDVISRASRCYTLPSGNRVHVKPGCRC